MCVFKDVFPVFSQRQQRVFMVPHTCGPTVQLKVGEVEQADVRVVVVVVVV